MMQLGLIWEQICFAGPSHMPSLENQVKSDVMQVIFFLLEEKN